MQSARPALMPALLLAVAVTLSALTAPAPAHAQTTGSIQRGPSGLPLPRFVSLKAERVNLRVGPGKEYAVTWRYMKAGVPLEIIQEFDTWRRVRDAQGDTGWVHGSLLSGSRTAIVSPWLGQEARESRTTLYSEARSGAEPVALLEPGVMGRIAKCDGAWCEMQVDHAGRTLKGFAVQADLWGAYPDETFE